LARQPLNWEFSLANALTNEFLSKWARQRKWKWKAGEGNKKMSRGESESEMEMEK